jgi:hypothetical protein
MDLQKSESIDILTNLARTARVRKIFWEHISHIKGNKQAKPSRFLQAAMAIKRGHPRKRRKDHFPR